MMDFGNMVRQLMMQAVPVGDVVPFRKVMPSKGLEGAPGPYMGGRGRGESSELKYARALDKQRGAPKELSEQEFLNLLISRLGHLE